MAAIIFYTNPMSRGQIARWALHEAGADYEQVLLEYGGSMKSPEFLAINPMGKVPTILSGGQVITECAAICAWLADAYPDARLAPTAAERADYYRWLFFAAGPVEAAVTNHAMGFDPASDKEMMFGYGNFDRVVDVLEALFDAHDYVCGARFTAADIYVGSQVLWGTQFGTIPKRPSLERYAARLSARAAYQAAKAIDDALIAEAQAGTD
jgi:glutathione S-transferase